MISKDSAKGRQFKILLEQRNPKNTRKVDRMTFYTTAKYNRQKFLCLYNGMMLSLSVSSSSVSSLSASSEDTFGVPTITLV